MAPARGLMARERLQQWGYAVQWHDHPMAHEVCAEEIEQIADFLRRMPESFGEDWKSKLAVLEELLPPGVRPLGDTLVLMPPLSIRADEIETLVTVAGFIPIALKNISELDPSRAEYIVDWLFFTLVSLLPLAVPAFLGILDACAELDKIGRAHV